MIDLHLHTTASDGRCAPAELVRRAWGAGVTTLSVTDHDTLAGLTEASTAAERHGVRFVRGIEITAVADAKDVHVLGYFLNPDADAVLEQFLALQREDRVRRVLVMGTRLAELGAPIDVEGLVQIARHEPGRSIGRPQVALALVRAGHVATPSDAFTRFIGEGGPAYVPRQGQSPAEVVRLIGDAGGIASLAHPGRLRRDDLVPGLVRAGLTALEAYHSDHDPQQRARYLELAQSHGLAVSGGSDYHGESNHRKVSLGDIGLPAEHFAELEARARRG